MSEDEVWESTSANRVEVGGYTEQVDGEVEQEDVKRVASDNGVKKFRPHDEDGQLIAKSDFPYDGDVQISEYNENA